MNVELRDWINDEILPYLPHDRVRQGDKIVFRCPICGDSKKSSTKMRGYYYLKTASYHCFNCDANLSGMKLLERLSGEDLGDIRSKYFKAVFDGRHFGDLSASYAPPSADGAANPLNFTSAVKPSWKKPLSEGARAYLRDRMVLDAPFLRESLYSYVSKKGGEYILIPWRINGVDAYFQLNDYQRLGASGMKYIFPKNRDKLVYGLDNVDMSFPYLICFEGVYDSLFVPNGIAIGGKNLTELQGRILAKRFPGHRIVYALDNDRAGLESTARTLSRNVPLSALYFRWFGADTAEKDVNDFVRAKGDPRALADRELVRSMICDPISMKLWLAKGGYIVGDDKGKQKRPPRKVR